MGKNPAADSSTIVNEDMSPAITFYQSSLCVRNIIDNLPSEVQLSDQTKEKLFEYKEPVEKAFKHEKCWEDVGHFRYMKVLERNPMKINAVQLVGVSIMINIRRELTLEISTMRMPLHPMARQMEESMLK